MSGYDKHPDYGEGESTRWASVVEVVAAVLFYVSLAALIFWLQTR
ncbi:hypothetical protein [Jiella endophytica]|nr:hypothetical protein [Jiella endophytica]